jgi:AraC-like DNA-binding protein
VVPDGASELILNFAEPFESFSEGEWRKQPVSFLTGQITGVLRLRSAGLSRILGVRFLPHGAGKALGFPMTEVRDSIVPVAELSTGLARELSRADGFERVEAALIGWKQRAGREDRLVDAAVRELESGATAEDVAAGAGISRRQLERRFSNLVGLTPKHFQRMRRFQRVFQVMEGDARGWADAAISCGYYDQAHLIRDFKEFSGETPSVLLASDELARHFLRRKGVSQFSNTKSAGSR